MKNSQKGFLIPLLIIIVAVLAIGTGVYVYSTKGEKGRDDTTINSTSPEQTQVAAISTTSKKVTSLSSCQDITKPGNYKLTSNLKKDGSPCLTIHDVSDVIIDCDKHSIQAVVPVSYSNVKKFSLSSCVLISPDPYGLTINITKSSNGQIKNNTIGKTDRNNTIFATESSNISITDNIINAFYSQTYTFHTVLERNTLNPLQPGIVASFYNGSWNKIISNKMDGKASGDANNKDGADDVIFLGDEHNDIVQYNMLKNAYDCGIETLGVITDTKIIGNVIVNAGFCGIGGWYHSSWKNNIVSDNKISKVPQMFRFFRTWALRPVGWDILKKMPADTGDYFQNNTFTKNIFSEPKIITSDPFKNTSQFDFSVPISISTPGSNEYVAGERAIAPNDVIVSNNTFASNNFIAQYPAPVLLPASGFIDKIENICGVHEAGYPLSCGSLSLTVPPGKVSLRILSPQPNYGFTTNSTFLIKWSTTNIPSDAPVFIDLVGQNNIFRIAQNIANSGEYNLFILKDTSGTVLPDGQYSIKICAVSSDVSTCDIIGPILLSSKG